MVRGLGEYTFRTWAVLLQEQLFLQRAVFDLLPKCPLRRANSWIQGASKHPCFLQKLYRHTSTNRRHTFSVSFFLAMKEFFNAWSTF